MRKPPLTPEQFFGDAPQARKLFDAVAEEIARLGDTTLRVSKSQVAFRRRRNFAVVWRPGMYLSNPRAQLVLTMSFAEKDGSPRWKEVTKVSARRFTHHLELNKVKDVDAQVKAWLRAAWEAAA